MTDPQTGFLRDYFGLLSAAAELTPQREAELFALRDAVAATGRRGAVVRIVANGGSLAIASHIAADMSKNVGIPCAVFDAAFVSCLTNDYGHEAAYAHGIRLTAQPGDLVIGISSSGRSKNIANALDQARSMGLPTVGLVGMDAGSAVEKAADLAIRVDSRAYNIIETVHQFWLMSVIDMLIGEAEYQAVRVTERRG